MEKQKQSPDIDSLIWQQREYFATGATRTWKARKDALDSLEKSLVAHRDAILQVLAEDLGKPAVEAYLAEYFFLIQELRLIRKSLKKWLKTRRVGSPVYFWPCRSQVRRDPFGTVLILAPWNYPVQLSLSPLIAAVAAGNTVVLKPSEISSSCERLLVKIISEAFDPGHVDVVTGDGDVAAALLEKKFDFIFFTGSTQIGKVVAAKAAERLTPNILELGGKCPAVVDATANIEAAAERILTGKFFNGAQTCFAPDYVAVEQGVKDALIKEMKSLLESVPWSQEMSHVINKRHFERLENLIPEDALKFGKDDGLKMAPRLVPNAHWDDTIMEEEIFGPILPIVTFKNHQELVSRINSYGSPLSLYIFSENTETHSQLMRDVRSGGVCINDTMKQGSNLNLPFGGVGDSGYGRYRGCAGVHAFSYERAVVKRSSRAPEMFALMPSYGDKINLLKRFLR